MAGGGGARHAAVTALARQLEVIVAVSGRPERGEFADYAAADIERVRGNDAIAALGAQAIDTLALLRPLSEDAVAGLRYAVAKWTLKEVVGHLCDDERIFAYRMLCIARGDSRPLPGFDERQYVDGAGFESQTLMQLLNEYRVVRDGTIALLSGLPAEAWLRRGIVNEYSASVRGLAFHIVGRELHHIETIRNKYLAGLSTP